LYLVSMTIRGLRPIDTLRIAFDPAEAPGWHVVIGPNGSGKSTLVRALAMAMLSDRDMDASRVPLDRWARPEAGQSLVEVAVQVPARRGRGRGRRIGKAATSLSWTTRLHRDGTGAVVSQKEEFAGDASEMPWNVGTGLFSASFGPLRRLAGGDKEHEATFMRRRRLGAHLSALDDGVALVEAERWLQEMHVEELEAERELMSAFEGTVTEYLATYLLHGPDAGPATPRRGARGEPQSAAVEARLGRIEREINSRMTSGALKAVAFSVSVPGDVRIAGDTVVADTDIEIDTLSRRIVRFVNASGFLFDQIKIAEIRKDHITVVTGDGRYLGLDQLSDGYRSIIGLGFELLRLMLAEYGLEEFQRGLNEREGFVDLPGVVTIDEVEAHLHPPWQEEIGEWLRRCFPRIQFIVTTHSPIVCRPIADPERLVRGSVWLINPSDPSGDGIERITGERLLRLVYGDLLEAVGTDAFGSRVEQSEVASMKMDRLAELNRREIHGRLGNGERGELTQLRGIFAAQPGILPG
jgi:energy-coupling factor transporter ATP-binding protein EcfA2